MGLEFCEGQFNRIEVRTIGWQITQTHAPVRKHPAHALAGNGAHNTPSDGIPATQASLWYPNGVAVDARENIFIADTFQNRIRAMWAG
jgi:hypothetical protein